MATREALAQENRRNLERVTTLLLAESKKLLANGDGLTQQELGGFLRQLVPGIIAQYGNVNAVLAVNYYDVVRELFSKSTKSYKAYIPNLDPFEEVDSIVGYGMAHFQEKGFTQLPDILANAITRPVTNWNRDTMRQNSISDPARTVIQRVARADACAFCAMAALNSTKVIEGETMVISPTSYRKKFHDQCHCTEEVIFQGEDLITPPYYQTFQMQYDEAQGGTTSEVLATIRQQTGRS